MSGGAEFRYVSAIGKGEVNLDLGMEHGRRKDRGDGLLTAFMSDGPKTAVEEDARLAEQCESALGHSATHRKNRLAAHVVGNSSSSLSNGTSSHASNGAALRPIRRRRQDQDKSQQPTEGDATSKESSNPEPNGDLHDHEKTNGNGTTSTGRDGSQEIVQPKKSRSVRFAADTKQAAAPTLRTRALRTSKSIGSGEMNNLSAMSQHLSKIMAIKEQMKEQKKKSRKRAKRKAALAASAEEEEEGEEDRTSTTTTTTTTKRKPAKKSSQVGKAHPVRDLIIFAGFLIFMFFIAYLTKDIGKPSPLDGMTQSQRLHHSMDQLATKIKKKEEEQKKLYEALRQDHCSLFWAASAIPQVGFSLFVGQAYQKGDVVVEPSFAYHHQLMLSQNQDSTTTVSTDMAYMIHHHPLRANVDARTGVALRDIQVGEELYLNWTDYPFQNSDEEVPLMEHYEMADAIIADIVDAALRSRRKRRRSPQQEDGIGVPTLDLIKKAVSHMDPRVAKLLPATGNDLHHRIENFRESQTGVLVTSAIHAMRDADLGWLQVHGQCLDSGMTGTEEDEEATSDLFRSRRNIKSGRAIWSIPLFATTTSSCSPATDSSGSSTCSSSAGFTCFGHAESSMQLCPMLSSTTHVPDTAWSSSHNQTVTPNAKLEWSPWNDKKVFRKVSNWDVQQIVERQHSMRLSLDVVATRSIKEGDAIIVRYPGAVTDADGSVLSPPSFPKAWMQITTTPQQDTEDEESSKVTEESVTPY